MIRYAVLDSSVNITLQGEFGTNILKDDITMLYTLLNDSKLKSYVLDLNHISKFDFTFLIFLYDYGKKLAGLDKSMNFMASSENAKRMIELLKEIEITKDNIPIIKKEPLFKRIIYDIGMTVCDYTKVTIDFLNFIGNLIYCLFTINPKKLRFNAINYHIFNGVITAMPVIFIVSFIVGGVIAYQGAATLSRIGFAGISVEMTAKLTLREIGPFVVALIVAGRSASSYTAQIGVMKMTEEIDAMKTMKLKLFDYIIIPRFIALIVTFPLMVFLSDLVSIFGCMVFLKLGFSISFYDYISQLKEFVDLNSFWTGIIKAPFYAATIVIIGCFVGFRVEDNTQSVGEKTTMSVVSALFGVILINALFSLIFTELNF